jgi:hypothetical protein
MLPALRHDALTAVTQTAAGFSPVTVGVSRDTIASQCELLHDRQHELHVGRSNPQQANIAGR